MYKILSIAPPQKKESFEYIKLGLILQDENKEMLGGSIYYLESSPPSLSVGDLIEIEEIKKNKDGSVTFRGVNKTSDNKNDIPLLF